MRTRELVSAEKLRGGFYSPEPLVAVCLDRVLELARDREDLRLLEPSAGDGAFFRTLARHPLRQRLRSADAIELLPHEAAKAHDALRSSGLPGEVATGSALDPEVLGGPFDVAVGNPPFVRFQFVSPDDKALAVQLGTRLSSPLRGVSNLWIPVILSALERLNDGGVFSFIVPAECFTGLSGQVVRSWLNHHTDGLVVDLFPPRSFPKVLQEVVVLSGRVRRTPSHEARVEVHDHGLDGSWTHTLDPEASTWTGLLLRPEHVEAITHVSLSDRVLPFREVARLTVATVTGANGYFCINDDIRQDYDLDDWTRPLLDRVRHAPGLRYQSTDHDQNRQLGRTTWLLDSALTPGPTAGARAYIGHGEQQRLHERYKTRIRKPWWRVPVVPPGSLMMSKRSNHYPRLIDNAAGVVTTDTVYQGSPLPAFAGREQDIVGSFHNSLTLLSAEMFGRSFGGGVLELVPSETARLLLPLVTVDDEEFSMLDRTTRTCSDPEELVSKTDALVISQLDGAQDAWPVVADARSMLRDRRLARTGART